VAILDAEGAPRQAVFNRICGSAGAQLKAPVCRKWREGFSPSSGRIEENLSPVYAGKCEKTGKISHLAYVVLTIFCKICLLAYIQIGFL